MQALQIPLWVNILSVIVGLGITYLMAIWPGISERRKARKQRESKLSYATPAPKERVITPTK
jgi:hypothetical protein